MLSCTNYHFCCFLVAKIKKEKCGYLLLTYEQMQITTGKYHTFLISNSSVYSCGSSLCGVLGHGSETTQCVTFSRISFPSLAHVVQVSASHNHAAFVMQSGEVSSYLRLMPLTLQLY